MSRRCPLCEGTASGVAFPFEARASEFSFSYLRCGSCGCVYVDPSPTPEQLERVYSWDRYHAKHYASDTRTRDRAALRVLARFVPSNALVLDFGCGAGDFMISTSQAGYEVVGVEITEDTRKKVKARTGLPVFSLEELGTCSKGFDVIHMRDVFPHLVEPLATMRRLESLMAQGGVFFFDSALEDNRSLVLLFSSLWKRVQRAVGRGVPVAGIPTMLIRMNCNSQQRFLIGRLGYSERFFQLYESGWPYYSPQAMSRTPSQRFKHLIGWTAAALSRFPPFKNRWGNRFYGIYEIGS